MIDIPVPQDRPWSELLACLGAAWILCLVAMLVPSVAVARPVAEAKPYIVVLNDDVAHPANVAHRHEENRGVDVGHVYGAALKGYSAEIPLNELEAIKRDPTVDYVETDKPIHVAGQAPPFSVYRVFANQNGVADIDEKDDVRIDADVAVLDTGVEAHPDLNVVSQVDCLATSGCTPAATPITEQHGTAVAGFIGALDNNYGVVGTAPGARIWSVRVLGLSSDGSDLLAGINWVTAHSDQIEVANLSLAGGGVSPAAEEAIATSEAKGVVYVVAAGNESFDAKYVWPASFPEVITVSAITDFDAAPGGVGSRLCVNNGYDYGRDDYLAPYSNFGAVIDIAAPGTCNLSTTLGGKYAMQYAGTSFAAPLVSGAAALLASQYNPNSRADVDWVSDTLRLYGNGGWIDTAPDGIKEPLLDMKALGGSSFAIRSGVPPRQFPPALAINGPTFVSYNAATLSGSINPQGVDANSRFECGTDGVNYPLKSAVRYVATTSSWVNVAIDVTGLAPGTVYRCRMWGQSTWGTTTSNEISFRTEYANLPRIYFVSKADSTIRQVEYNGPSGWSQSGPLSLQVAPGTSPSAFLNSEGRPRVYYVAASDSAIHELSWNPGYGWANGPARSYPVKGGTSPSAIAWPNGGARIYYVARDDSAVHEVSFNLGSGWADSGPQSYRVAPNSSPSAFLNTEGRPRVYYSAEDTGAIHELSWNPSIGWRDGGPRSYPVKAGTSPSAFAWPNGGARIYYASQPDGAIHEVSYTSGVWADSGPQSYVAMAGSSPSGFLNSEGRPRVFYAAEDTGAVHEMSWNPNLGWADGGPRTYPLALKSSPSAFKWYSGGVRTYYVRREDNKLYELSYNPTVWANSAALSEEVAPNTSPTAILFNPTF